MVWRVQDLSMLGNALVLVSGSAILLMLLPAIIELKKPQDKGPRLIADYYWQMGLGALQTSLINMEEETLSNSWKVKRVFFLANVSNIEF